MGRNTKLCAIIAVVLGACAIGATECETEYSCTGSCHKLASCEDEWLEDDGEEPMSEQQMKEFMSDCMKDCDESSSVNICIGKASCDELSDGKCTDDFVF